MVTAAAGGYSRVFTVSFCNTCSDTDVFMSGEPPFEIRAESEIEAKSGVKFGGLAEVPKVKLEADILSTIRNAGVNEGTCSVKVNLATKEVVFIEAHKWGEHECMGGRSIGDIVQALYVKAMASEDGWASIAGSCTILRVVSQSSLTLVAKSQIHYGDLSATMAGEGVDICIDKDGVVRAIPAGPSTRTFCVGKKV